MIVLLVLMEIVLFQSYVLMVCFLCVSVNVCVDVVGVCDLL